MEPLLKRSISRLIFLIGLLCCVIWFLADPKWDSVIAFFSMMLGFVATLEKRTPNVYGVWSYHVRKSGQTFSHAGRCELVQSENGLKIYGHRYVYMAQVDGKPQLIDGDWSWESSWGQVGSDSYLRFDYTINLTDENDHVSAICKVHIESKTEMSGNYYRLPPFKGNTVNAQWGTIKFRKLKGDKAHLVPPPLGYGLNGTEL